MDATAGTGASTASTERSVHLRRTGPDRYLVTNRRGGRLTIGAGERADFTPVELLLAGLAGCSAIDIDLITGRRAQADLLEVTARGDKVRDEHGNHLVDLRLVLDISFPPGPDGDRAREVLPRTVERVRDRLCTVSRTVALGEPVDYVIATRPDGETR